MGPELSPAAENATALEKASGSITLRGNTGKTGRNSSA